MKQFFKGVLRLTARYAMVTAISLPAAFMYSFLILSGHAPGWLGTFALIVPTLIVAEWAWRRTGK